MVIGLIAQLERYFCQFNLNFYRDHHIYKYSTEMGFVVLFLDVWTVEFNLELGSFKI